MTWQPWLLAAAPIATAVLGWITLRQSRRSDKQLNVNANIQTLYEAQAGFIDDLRADVVRLRASNEQCEEATNFLRRSLADSHLERDAQSREAARLKAVVNEHEESIARHEATINAMLRASRHES